MVVVNSSYIPSQMSHYKNGWVLFEKMLDIYPGAANRGQNKFSPRSAGPLASTQNVEATADDIDTAPSGLRNDPIFTGNSEPRADPAPTTIDPTPTAIDLTNDTNDSDMLVDDDVTDLAQNASSTLISSVASGKRKVQDVEEYADSRSTASEMPPPSSSAHAASAASAVSAVSVASSGTSEKRRKIKKETPAAASMRSSRESSSRKPPSMSSTVMHQQVLARFDHLVDRMDHEPANDPLTIKQTQAIQLLEANKIEFDLSDEEFATVAMAYSINLGYLTTYLNVKQSSTRHAFIRKIVEQGNS